MQFKSAKNQKKRIIIINHYGRTPESRGTTRHFDMAKKIAQNFNAEVELWICGNDRQLGTIHESLKWKIISSQKYDNIKVVRIRSISDKKGNGFRRQLNITIFSIITGLMILFGRKKDLVILSVPPLSFFNALMIKLRNIKLVVDVEDLWPLFLKDLGLKNKFVLTIMEKTANYLYNKADAIDTVSESMKEFVKGRLKNKNKLIWVSPLGVNVKKYSTAKISKKNYSWKDKFSVIYAGAHGKANGLKTILDAAKILSNYNDIAIVLIGDGGEKQSLIKYAKRNNLKNVFFEKAVPHDSVPSVLKLADVCITHLKKVDSFKYVRPNKIFEYMAVSKPIICGIHGEAADIVTQAKAGIVVEPENPIAIADAIIKLYNNRNLLTEYGNNGFKYIYKNGDRGKILNEYCKKIEKFLQ